MSLSSSITNCTLTDFQTLPMGSISSLDPYIQQTALYLAEQAVNCAFLETSTKNYPVCWELSKNLPESLKEIFKKCPSPESMVFDQNKDNFFCTTAKNTHSVNSSINGFARVFWQNGFKSAGNFKNSTQLTGQFYNPDGEIMPQDRRNDRWGPEDIDWVPSSERKYGNYRKYHEVADPLCTSFKKEDPDPVPYPINPFLIGAPLNKKIKSD